MEKKNPAEGGASRPGLGHAEPGVPVRYRRGTGRARVRRRDQAYRLWWFCPVIQRARGLRRARPRAHQTVPRLRS